MGDLVVQEETHQVDTVLQEDAGELVEQIETVVVDIQDRKGTAHSKMKIYILDQCFFCELLLNGALYDTKIGCIQFL